jgi:enoyl-CoA hydratase/carnithine racemase
MSLFLFLEYEHILAEVRGKTGLITLNRPKALNALCTPLMNVSAACACSSWATVTVIVIVTAANVAKNSNE